MNARFFATFLGTNMMQKQQLYNAILGKEYFRPRLHCKRWNQAFSLSNRAQVNTRTSLVFRLDFISKLTQFFKRTFHSLASAKLALLSPG